MAQTTPLGNGSFPEGTRIATRLGLVRVEQLNRGDIVLTDTGPDRLSVLTPRPPASPSVLVRADAFGPGAPATDLHLSTEHMVHLRDPAAAEPVLVPVGALINGTSITRLPIVAAVSWVTIGFERHALVRAEGLPLAALRPDGAPLLARQMPPGPALFALRGKVGRGEIAADWPAPELPAAAPVQPVDMPVLQLLVDGTAAPPAGDAASWRFTIPPAGRELRLVSPVGLPPSSDDIRCFGVAVRGLSLDGIPLALDGPVAGEGFYDVEGEPRVPGGAWRWTDGNARLVIPPARRARRLEVSIADWHLLLRRVAVP